MKTAGVTHSLNKGKTSVLCQIFGKMKIYKKKHSFFCEGQVQSFYFGKQIISP